VKDDEIQAEKPAPREERVTAKKPLTLAGDDCNPFKLPGNKANDPFAGLTPVRKSVAWMGFIGLVVLSCTIDNYSPWQNQSYLLLFVAYFILLACWTRWSSRDGG
jgi:hypothetical protein